LAVKVGLLLSIIMHLYETKTKSVIPNKYPRNKRELWVTKGAPRCASHYIILILNVDILIFHYMESLSI